MAYKNKDGLWIYFPGDDREAHGGEYAVPGTPDRVTQVIVDLTKQGTGVTAKVLNPGILDLPRNAQITRVETLVRQAAVGGTSLAVGLKYYDAAAEYDYDGLLTATAGAIANLTPTGKRIAYDQQSANAGALVGTTLAYPGEIVITTVGTFTAGLVEVRVHYSVPGKDANPTQFNP